MRGSKVVTYATRIILSCLLAMPTLAGAGISKQGAIPAYLPQASELGAPSNNFDLDNLSRPAESNSEQRLIAYCSSMGGFRTYEGQRAALNRQRALRNRGTAAEQAERLEREISVKQTKEDQSVLWELDYYEGPIDGKLSPDTKAAIARFRGDNDLGVGTTLNKKSREMLYDGNVSSKTAFDSVNETKANKSFQKALRDLNYYDGAIDGTFDAETEAALDRFRQANGIESDEAKLDSETSTALLEGQAEVKWIRRANGDGVSVIKVAPYKDGYRVRTGDSEYYYETDVASKVERLIRKTLSNDGVEKVVVDGSELSEADRRKNIDAAVGKRSTSTVGIIRQPGSLKTLFSREVEVLGASPPAKLPSGYYKSVIELHSPKWIESEIRIVGSSEELTSKFTEELREIYAVESENQPTLQSTLRRVRTHLKRTGDIKVDDDLEVQLKEPDQKLEIL